jgi:hypothetical protein
LLLGWRSQGITLTPDSLDIVLAIRGIGELLAQLPDEDINNLRLRLIDAAVKMIGYCPGLATAIRTWQ